MKFISVSFLAVIFLVLTFVGGGAVDASVGSAMGSFVGGLSEIEGLSLSLPLSSDSN
jgi:hypothetical protein